MDDEHVRPLLEDDDQPSWVTLQGPDDSRSTAGSTQSAWDRLAAAAKKTNRSAKNGGGNNRQAKSSDDELPRIVLFMRLGNLAAAGLVIFGSVSYRITVLAIAFSVWLHIGQALIKSGFYAT